ncbi:Unknown [Streptococcus agalactiae ILRI112]|nr:Unknown [Streptococcus agalactiae ILRI112]HEO6601055.1 hypothetical protein [Streptococcus agalactiae]HEO6606868.1 hypothetical protein [Streptococcus agalactiae]HEO6632642.1 hypothetical protein [Streptococcus agalactiae]
MTYSYSEYDLNRLNQGENVYSVNPDYAKKINAKVITASPEKKNETNIITTEDRKKFLLTICPAIRVWQLHQLSRVK